MTSVINGQFSINPVNNTLGIFYHKMDKLKVTNDKWQLLVYKDLDSIRQTIDNNNKILDNILETINNPLPRVIALKSEVQTHVSLLTQISNTIELKYEEIMAGTDRQKRGLINGLGTIWKSITGNLDSTDGQYFNDCINKIERDERQLGNLLKQQISVTTSVIKNFNNTIQKLQIDEETFNKDIENIQTTLLNIGDDLSYYESRIQLLDLCESIMESYTFIKDELDNILNSITFARLKIIHATVIKPLDLLNSLKEISHSLKNTELPFPIEFSSISNYLDVIELKAFQLDNRIVFVLNIPLLEPENYLLYRIYPIPLIDNRTTLLHILSTSTKFIARDDDSISYLQIHDLENCRSTSNFIICPNHLPHPIDHEAICEAQLLKPATSIPKNCQPLVISATGYQVKEIQANTWLVLLSEITPITIRCQEDEPITRMVHVTSIIQFQSKCTAYIGNTKVHFRSQPLNAKVSVNYKQHPVVIPFNCCVNFNKNLEIPKLEPLRLNKLDVEDLNIASHQLDQYSKQLDQIMNEPLISNEISWSTIVMIIIVMILIVLYFWMKCKKKRGLKIGIINTNDDQPPRPSPNALRQSIRRYLPRRRPSIHLGEPVEDIELNLNKMSV